MSNEEKYNKGINRRTFIAGSAISAAGIAAASLLPGCTPKESTQQTPTGETVKPSFETPPAPIPESQIKSTFDADVVVVGAGMSGLCAAISAAETGAKTILLEKGATANFRGIDYGAVNSKKQKAIGNVINRNEIIAELMRWSSYKADQRVVSLWADNSGAVADWIADIAEAAGIKVTAEPVEDQLIPNYYYKVFPANAMVFEPSEQVVAATPKGHPGPVSWMYMMTNKAKALGIDIYYNTPAAQLVRVDKGRVTAVIAKKKDGSYAKFNARKGIILATGDYGNDPEMLKAYIPSSSEIYGIAYPNQLNTGDGHKMGIWVGADIDELPHAPMYFDHGLIGMPAPYIPVPLTRQPWLSVNLRGERFSNEDEPYGYICNSMRQQIDHVKWVVWDSKWPQEAPKFHMTVCKALRPPLHDVARVEELIQKDIIKSAATLDELIQKMQVPADTFKATVARYNELAKLGKDLDFGKRSECLTTIEKAPLYAVKMGAVLLVTLGGLKVNDKLQVLDKDLNVIPGLYASGNVSGSFFATDYPIVAPGVSHGRAFTFGYLAGKNVVKLG